MSNTPAGLMSDDIRAPMDTLVDNTTGADGLFVLTLTIVSQRFQTPSAWRGRYVDVRCDGGTGLHIVFGNSTVVADKAQESTVTAEVITFKKNSTAKVEPATKEPYRIPVSATSTHFAILGESAAGRIRANLSTGDGNA